MQATTPWFTCKFDFCQNLAFWQGRAFKLCFQPVFDLVFQGKSGVENFAPGDKIRIRVTDDPVMQGHGWQCVHWLRSCDGYNWVYILKHWYQAPEWAVRFVRDKLFLSDDERYFNLWLKLEVRRKA